MDKPHYIEDLTKEISHFREDFNDHKSEDKEWKTNHEKMDHEAFGRFESTQKETNDKLDGLYSGVANLSKDIKSLRDEVSPGQWLFKSSKGFALLSEVPKALYIIIIALIMLALFGFKAVWAFILSKI